jgi:hypothetical protein
MATEAFYLPGYGISIDADDGDEVFLPGNGLIANRGPAFAGDGNLTAKITTARFATPTNIAQVTWTDPNLGGLTPKAVMIIANHADTDGVVEAGSRCQIGFADGTLERSWGVSADDGINPPNTGRGASSSQVIDLFIGPGSPQVTANFVSFQADSVTLDFTLVDSDAQLYTVVFFAGSALNAHVNTVELGTGTSPINVTDPGFPVDMVFGGGVGLPDDFAPISTSIFFYGVAVNDGADTNKSINWNSRDGSAVPTELAAHLISDSVGGQLNAGTQNWDAIIDDFDAVGFSITPQVSSASDDFSYLAIGFGGVASPSLRSFDSPTSMGNDVRTGLDFEPQFVMLIMSDLQVEDSIVLTVDAGAIGFSMFTEDAEFSNAWADEDSANPSNTQSLSDNQAVNFASGDGTTQHAATFVSLNADGHTLNYSVADGTARKWIEVAISVADAGGRLLLINPPGLDGGFGTGLSL